MHNVLCVNRVGNAQIMAFIAINKAKQPSMTKYSDIRL